MATGRLSRQELGWLLAQEARGAASALRKDVTLLTQPPPPDSTAQTHEVQLESTLNALDDAIGLLSQLEAGPPQSKGRRGRIDVASLLCDVAPQARIAIEPGTGTEVFGEEAELRRLLHVLVSQANTASGSMGAAAEEIRIRGQDDWIRITVDLGPDVAAGGELERRWLSRMAIRLGGKLELDSGTQSVRLPADASADRSEVADLKKELAQAQQQGETYARELVMMLGSATNVQPATSAATEETESAALRRGDLLVSVAAALARGLRLAFRGLNDDARLAADRLGDTSPLAESLHRRAALGMDLVQDLTHLEELDLRESPTGFNPVEIATALVGQVASRMARRNVEASVDPDGPALFRARRSPFTGLVRALLIHAIDATPNGQRISIRFRSTPQGLAVEVQDGGPTPPAAARLDLLEHRVDPLSIGRPAGVSLLAASALAARLGGQLQLEEASPSGTLCRVTLPAS